MELPEDVLAIVRAYSKPVFPYFKEYRLAMRVLGMKNWKALKEKIHTNPVSILPVLGVYLDAFVHKKKVYEERETILQNCLPEERDYAVSEIHNRAFYAKREEEDLFWALVRLLYGDGKSYWDIREDQIRNL